MRMRILLDAIPLTGLLTGISRYVRNLYTEMEKLPGVVSAKIVTGRYDIILTFLMRSHTKLVDFITNRLATIKGVRGSETFIVLSSVSHWLPIDLIIPSIKEIENEDWNTQRD